MIHKSYTATINLNADDVSEIIRQHFGLPAEAKINYRLSDISDDRMGGSPHYAFTGADVTHQVSAEVTPFIKYPPGVR